MKSVLRSMGTRLFFFFNKKVNIYILIKRKSMNAWKGVFNHYEYKNYGKEIFYHTDFIIITFYRLKARRGTSSGEEKGHLLGHIPY